MRKIEEQIFNHLAGNYISDYPVANGCRRIVNLTTTGNCANTIIYERSGTGQLKIAYKLCACTIIVRDFSIDSWYFRHDGWYTNTTFSRLRSILHSLKPSCKVSFSGVNATATIDCMGWETHRVWNNNQCVMYNIFEDRVYLLDMKEWPTI